ncbi:MAG: hypothetical protein HY537_06200 [Deltaproteobacteria bacterium]|nr:hypothetical protein [Deltaproteobacteria bacterium]
MKSLVVMLTWLAFASLSYGNQCSYDGSKYTFKADSGLGTARFECENFTGNWVGVCDRDDGSVKGVPVKIAIIQDNCTNMKKLRIDNPNMMMPWLEYSDFELQKGADKASQGIYGDTLVSRYMFWQDRNESRHLLRFVHQIFYREYGMGPFWITTDSEIATLSKPAANELKAQLLFVRLSQGVADPKAEMIKYICTLKQ